MRRNLATRQLARYTLGALVAAAATGCSLLSPTDPSPTDKGGTTTPTFKVNAVVAGVDNARVSAPCPTKLNFTGTITTSAAGNVTYKWERSDGASTAVQTMVFAAAGAQTSTTQWELATGTTGWQLLHVLTPNELKSNQASFSASCAPPGPVTAVTLAVDSATFSGACPHRFTFTGSITATSAATVTYQWEKSDGSASGVQTLTFTGAGTQNVTNVWDVTATGARWQRLHVLTPNDQLSSQAAFSTTCSS